MASPDKIDTNVPSEKEELAQLLAKLESQPHPKVPSWAFAGFDGFVDTIQRAVLKRDAGSDPDFFSSIEEFSRYLSTFAAKSGQVELHTMRVKAGGNAPIFANAISSLNVRCTCAGSMGKSGIDPLFAGISKRTELISIVNPGRSQAIEFDDGKIILSDLEPLYAYDWGLIKAHADIKRITARVSSSGMVGLLDWANLPHATGIWAGFLEDIIKPVGRRDHHFLFDLCDPAKRSPEAIREVLQLIGRFSENGEVTLGLNENEAVKVWRAISNYDKAETPDRVVPSLASVAGDILGAMAIHTVLIHPVDRVIVSTQAGTVEIKGRVIKNPRLLTGAGDNLNAGYSYGLLNGLSIHQSARLGIAVAGAYVQNGESPGVAETIAYIREWLAAEDINQVGP